MASKSRAAQEKLAELEKGSAPFGNQLLEAAKFIGIDLDNVRRSMIESLDLVEEFGTAIYHGREEWLLRWLLKKLQAPKDDIPRKTPDSWILLCYLIRTITLPNAARMLSERKVMGILQQTLEEAQILTDGGLEAGHLSDIISASEERPTKASQKRKWSGELVEPISGLMHYGMQTLSEALFAATHHMVRFTKIASYNSDGGRTAAFSAKYMRAVIRTPAEDAAKILGSWFSLCQKAASKSRGSNTAHLKQWLSPFIEIWKFRIPGNEDLGRFSLYCSQPLLSLLNAVNTEEAPFAWMEELEQLVARNIIIPAKADKTERADSDLLNTLTRISVIQDSANASILFKIAIRSIQAQGPQRRRANDVWLESVFAALRAAMPSPRVQQNGEAVREMLRSAIAYKINLGLSTLRSITSEYGLLKDNTNWELLGKIIKLDVNVFLIPHHEENLLQEVLTRITTLSLDPLWSDLSVQVVSDVLVPLMNGFAKARDLSAFIRHWFAQLVEFERLRKEARLFSMALFSAWEDEVLQTEFSRAMEMSLTIPQIIQLLDWLSTQATQSPDAVCVILEAIAGSISREDVIDAVVLRLFEIIFDDAGSEKLGSRYKWRSWRILSRTLGWIDTPAVEVIAERWEDPASPFYLISNRLAKASLLEVVNGSSMELETLEAMRLTCALWDASATNRRLASLYKKPALDILKSLAQDIKVFLVDLGGDRDLGEEICGSTPNGLFRGIGWMLWSYVHCVFVEYPRMLELILETEGYLFKDLLQTVFWVASGTPDEPHFKQLNPWLHKNPDAFTNIWTSVLNNDEIINHKALRTLILDVMISSETNAVNPLVKSSTVNMFALRCLDQLRQDVFSRKDREHILKGWFLSSDPEVATDSAVEVLSMDPAVLSMKAKMMERAAVYDGMRFQDLAEIADGLWATNLPSPDESLVSFKELARRIMSHVTANLDQSRNRDYALDALKYLRKKMKSKSDSKKSHKLSYALIALFEVLIEAFANKKTQLNDLHIISITDFTSIETSFKCYLLNQLGKSLAKTKRPSTAEKHAEKSLTIFSMIDALTKLKANGSDLNNVVETTKSFTASLGEADTDVGKRLDTFISTHSHSGNLKATEVRGDPSTVNGRQAIEETVRALVAGKNEHQKLDILKAIFTKEAVVLSRLDGILAVRYIILACDDSRPSLHEDNNDDLFDLSTVYSVLCSHLWKSTTIRQFSLISETMALMLHTKNRAMNQWNIDSTLGSITIMCSRNAPRLRPTRAGTIFQHICQLLNTVLTTHRLKLQGHFHLVVQAMQALLRCFFTPLPHSTTKSSKLFAQPAWLSSPKHQLKATHAVSFTRLVTLICDPSVSSVTRSKNNNLNSATDKAKRIAGQHMQFLLMLYVKLQLEMKMLPEVREKMVPGLYAIFDTTTPEMRRMIGDGLDSSGRSVFGTLFRDYQRFGKWKGS